MIGYRTFTGGIFETNAYALEAPEGWMLFDAPEGACEWLVGEGVELRLLLLTHGHIDHIQDVAGIKRRFDCPVGIHPESAPMISQRDFFRDFGIGFELEPVEPDLLIEATASRNFLGMNFEILEVPGHCPGSLCFFSRETDLLRGGDGLFAGGVGRWDLPGGDGELLFEGIREKLYTLNEKVTVLPGHGPPTTIGAERRGNPFVRGT
ncbi:MAG TPA: MBL fold metallo-hydrolase [Chthoniobacterales bacterium]|nr:MBL fold metallo-hydrolase [Chthoniobacterales bacterium]